MAPADPDHVSTRQAGPHRPDRRSDMLRHFPTLLKRWQGADAQLREMTWSHRTLRLVLQLPDRGGFLSIACIDPLHIQAPVSWSGADIEIAVDDGDGFLV